jgi:predicted ATPase
MRLSRSVSVLQAYESRVSTGQIKSDAQQLAAVSQLDKLLVRVRKYARQRMDSPLAPAKSINSHAGDGVDGLKTAPDESMPVVPPKPRIPRGVYLHGHVGTGKSMLMDLFQSTALFALQLEGLDFPSRRVHFNTFLQEVHRRVHHWKEGLLRKFGRDSHICLAPERDAIAAVARQIAQEAPLLCFDEFQVTVVLVCCKPHSRTDFIVVSSQVNDIVDAVIMTKLFNTLFREGVVMVATSNQAPAQLYEVCSSKIPFHLAVFSVYE